MQYFVTIYIDILFEKSLVELDATHAFLGLTRKHPNVLDTMKFERETNKQIWSFELGKMIYIKKNINGMTQQKQANLMMAFMTLEQAPIVYSMLLVKSLKIITM